MPKQTRIRNPEPKLEPWAYEDDAQLIALSPQIENKSIEVQTLNLLSCEPSPKQSANPTAIPQKYYYVQTIKKSPQMNFVKRNQQQIKSHSALPSDYNSILTNDYDSFSPINPRSTVSSISRRPTIRTTYIGYYDENPLSFQSPLLNRKNQSLNHSTRCVKRRRPSTSGTRAKYDKLNPEKKSSLTLVENSNFIGSENSQQDCSVNTSHLQKMLKIKDKLRQKLKKNSEKKDRDRNLYLQTAMKQKRENNRPIRSSFSAFYDEKPQATPGKTSTAWHEERRRSSNELYNCGALSRSNRQKNSPSKKIFFAIIGGAINL